MQGSCQSVGSLIINHAEESFWLLVCFLLCLHKKKNKALSRNALNRWTKHLEFPFSAQKVQGKPVSQNDSLDR